MSNTNTDRILALLARQPGLDDDEISRITGIRPRQQVNQICRRLAGQKRLVRRPAASGKIGNYPIDRTSPAAESATVRVASPARPSVQASESTDSGALSAPAQLARTLILIPCSGSKSSTAGSYASCPPIAGDLPPALAYRLLQARSPVLARAGVDESNLLPAWRRYTGALYAAAHETLVRAIEQGLHVLVLSGGYGVVKACEPVGLYSTRLKLTDWPRGLLEETLVAYAKRHDLQSMRAFVSASTDYCRLIRRVPWRAAGIEDALVVTPAVTTGAMVKAPRAQGEALSTYLAGGIRHDWRSSDNLAIETMKL